MQHDLHLTFSAREFHYVMHALASVWHTFPPDAILIKNKTLLFPKALLGLFHSLVNAHHKTLLDCVESQWQCFWEFHYYSAASVTQGGWTGFNLLWWQPDSIAAYFTLLCGWYSKPQQAWANSLELTALHCNIRKCYQLKPNATILHCIIAYVIMGNLLSYLIFLN